MIHHGDCLEILRGLAADGVDSLVTDPPAGISFMGKDWDGDKGGSEEWIAWMTEVAMECLRVLKPGAHGLVWALPRTSHWTAAALERAGFEVRDCVTHLFGTGFPKSLDVSKAIDKAAGAARAAIRVNPNARLSQQTYALEGDAPNFRATYSPITAPATAAAKQWAGWGTALKPAAEFWWLVRKPLSEKTVAANVLKHGTGAINVDGGRIGANEKLVSPSVQRFDNQAYGKGLGAGTQVEPTGRFPANLILDEDAAAALDRQSGTLKAGVAVRSRSGGKNCHTDQPKPAMPDMTYADSGGASRFFYCAKASKADRGDGNTHPTVKSTALMRYLIRLVTPPGGLVLDPFAGSGSTGVAALAEGFRFLGIEREPEYHAIAERRFNANGQ